jgi:hypothetical protein
VPERAVIGWAGKAERHTFGTAMAWAIASIRNAASAPEIGSIWRLDRACSVVTQWVNVFVGSQRTIYAAVHANRERSTAGSRLNTVRAVETRLRKPLPPMQRLS